MLISELCRRTGTTKGAIRHYESLGLISSTPRQAGSRVYREFDEEAIRRIELIKNGKRHGFKLTEGRDLLDALINGDLGPVQRKYILTKRLNKLNSQIKELQSIRDELAKKMESI